MLCVGMPVSYLQHRQANGVFHNGQFVAYLNKSVIHVKHKENLPEKDDCNRLHDVFKVATSSGGRFFMYISLFCVLLLLLLELKCDAMNALHIPATKLTPPNYNSHQNMSLPAPNSFVPRSGFVHSCVMLMLLVIAGDVELNPGPHPDHYFFPKECVGWDHNGKEVNTKAITAAQLRQSVYVDYSGRKTIMMRNWKQLAAALGKLGDLQHLVICNDEVSLKAMAPAVSGLHRLVRLEMSGSQSTSLFPTTWMQTIQLLVSLRELDIESYDLSQCATGICSLNGLQQLRMQGTNLSSLPVGISGISNLKTLDVRVNELTSLPMDLFELTNLKKLEARNNALQTLPDKLPDGIQVLNVSDNNLNEFPACVLQLKQLQELDISKNNISLIPPSIRLLQHLEVLKLYGTPVTHLPTELSTLPQLTEIQVMPKYSWDEGDPCPLVQPPIELCKQGTPAILVYLLDLKQTLAPVRISRQKIVISGDTGGGKTSLCRTLCSGKSQLAGYEERTKVLEQIIWQPKPGIMLQINDFGGHSSYKVTQPFFISPKIIPLHVFNLQKYVVGSQESFDTLIGHWLTNLYTQTPNVKISIVGTHSDQLSESEITGIIQDVKNRLDEMQELKVEEVRRRIEKLKTSKTRLKPYLADLIVHKINKLKEELNQPVHTPDIFIVSNKTYTGVEGLSQHIIKLAEQCLVTLPKPWHNFILDVTSSKRKTGNTVFLTWSTVEQIQLETSSESYRKQEVESFIKQNLLSRKRFIDLLLYESHKTLFGATGLDCEQLLLESWVCMQERSPHRDKSVREKEESYKIQCREMCHLMQTRIERTTTILTYMRDIGEILFYPNSALRDVVFHDINILIDTMKAIFTHDLHGQLQYQNFKNFSEPTFSKMRRDVLDKGIFHVDLLHCLWQKLNIPEPCFSCLIELLKLFDLCYEVFNDDSSTKQLLFPWFIQNIKPDQAASLWCTRHDYQLTVEFHFCPRVPVNFFEVSLVILHRQFDPRISRSFIWKSGTCIQNDVVRYLIEKVNTSDDINGPKLRFAVRGDDLNDLWQSLLPVYKDLKRKLDEDWPGAMYDVFQVCPHCVCEQFEQPTLFPGEFLETDIKVKNVPCDNIKSGHGMIDSALICPSKQNRIQGDLSSASTLLAYHSQAMSSSITRTRPSCGSIREETLSPSDGALALPLSSPDVPRSVHGLPQGVTPSIPVPLPDVAAAEIRQPEMPDMPRIYAVLIAGSDDGRPKQFYRDVVYLKMVLTDKRIMGLRSEDLIVISPESTDPKRKLSADNVKAAIVEMRVKINAKVTEDLDKPKKDDLCFILYYSGHSKYGMLYLGNEESIPGNDIQRVIELMGISRKLVILDCCYSDDTQCLTADVDAQIPDCTERQIGFGSKSPSQILQWSSSGISQSSYYDVNKLSYFTDYIIRGLCSAQTSCVKGAAPECKTCAKFSRSCQIHGCVQLFPLMEYVHDHVQERTCF